MFVCGRSDVRFVRTYMRVLPSQHNSRLQRKGRQVFGHRIPDGVLDLDDEGKAWWDGEIPL